MSRNRLTVLEKEVPFVPLIPHERDDPIHSIRLRHAESLDHALMRVQLGHNIVNSLPYGDGDMDQYFTVNVFSPYVSSGYHLMTINVGRRFTPSPRWLPLDIAEKLGKYWGVTAEWMGKIHNILQFGYNWSPFSFGLPEEEFGGGLSLPTEHHLMMCAENNPKYTEIPFASLDPRLQRLLGANTYGVVLSKLIEERIAAITATPLFGDLFDSPTVDAVGLSYNMRRPIADTFNTDGFVTEIMMPCDLAIEELFQDITETMTDMRCAEIFRTLQKREAGIRNPAASPEEQAKCIDTHDVDFLRRTPKLAGSRLEIAGRLRANGYPDELMAALWPAVSGRCSMKSNMQKHDDMQDWWRKGFAYSWYLLQEEGLGGELRIAPFVYNGTCGMVEATSILLRRTTGIGPPLSVEDIPTGAPL